MLLLLCILVPAVADGSCVLQHIMSVMVMVLYSGGDGGSGAGSLPMLSWLLLFLLPLLK